MFKKIMNIQINKEYLLATAETIKKAGCNTVGTNDLMLSMAGSLVKVSNTNLYHNSEKIVSLYDRDFSWTSAMFMAEIKDSKRIKNTEFLNNPIRVKRIEEITNIKNGRMYIENEDIKFLKSEYKKLEGCLITAIMFNEASNLYKVRILIKKSYITTMLPESLITIISEEEFKGKSYMRNEKIIPNKEKIIEEMKSKLDIVKIKKILSGAIGIKSTELHGLEKIINSWAEAKLEIYLAFGKKFKIEKDIMQEKSSEEYEAELNEFVKKYPSTFYFICGQYGNAFKNKFEPLSSKSCRILGISNSVQKMTTILQKCEENTAPIEGFKNLTPEEIEEYKRLKSKVTFTSPILDDYSKIISETKTHGKIVLSIDPIDYLLMSVTKSGLTSCYSICKEGRCRSFGQFVQGIFAYIGDKSTIVSYMHSNKIYEYKIGGAKIDEINKSWRQLIYLDTQTGSFVTSREYPSHNDIVSKEVRELLEKTLSEYYKKENVWKTRLVSNNYQFIKSRIVEENPYVYNDIMHNNDLYYAKIVYHKENKEKEMLFETSKPVKCLCCGKEDIQHGNVLYCDSCMSKLIQ